MWIGSSSISDNTNRQTILEQCIPFIKLVKGKERKGEGEGERREREREREGKKSLACTIIYSYQHYGIFVKLD